VHSGIMNREIREHDFEENCVGVIDMFPLFSKIFVSLVPKHVILQDT